MKVKYIKKRLTSKKMELVEIANKICEEYLERGYILTLRQCYYQAVSKALIENNNNSYKRFGEAVKDGRLLGLIDWAAIEDRSRSLFGNNHIDNPAELIEKTVYRYKVDKWEGQPCYLECWIEKDALRQVAGKACAPLDVDYFPCKGYPSISELRDAALRFQRRADRECIILYLGDHDPSGVDMDRNLRDAMALYGADVKITRLALNMQQVQEYNPPPNFAKESDSRYGQYVKKYGEHCWELDAMKPEIMEDIIRAAIQKHMDADLFEAACQREAEGRAELRKLAANYTAVQRHLKELGA